MKSASWYACGDDGFVPVADGLDDLEGETDVREEMEVQDGVEKSESRSEAVEVVVAVDCTDMRAEGGRGERGCDGEKVMGCGGGTRRVLVPVREGAELLLEGVSARIDEELCEARLLVPEPRCCNGMKGAREAGVGVVVVAALNLRLWRGGFGGCDGCAPA